MDAFDDDAGLMDAVCAPLTRVLEVACAVMKRPMSVPLDAHRCYFHVGADHTPYGFGALSQAAKEAGVYIFRERGVTHPERGRFFMDGQQGVPDALLPFLSQDASNAAWDAGQADTAEKLLMAGAAAGLSAPLGRYPVATPDPVKDPEGYSALQRRFRQVGSGTRAAIVEANTRLISQLPDGHAAAFQRTVTVLQGLSTQRTMQHVR